MEKNKIWHFSLGGQTSFSNSLVVGGTMAENPGLQGKKQ